MGEHVYQFGDPVEVLRTDKWVACKYVFNDGDTELPIAVLIDHPEGAYLHWTTPNKIRPLPKPTRGWRLPEPGDVVSVHGSDHQRMIRFVDWGRSDPILTDDDLWWYVSSCKPVRLHDAPSPPPAPVESKPETPEPWVSFDKAEAQRLIADLGAASALIEWLERRESGSYRKSVQSVISRMINQVAIALGADR